MTATVTTPQRSGPDFAERPMLVFWETTRACPLACRHCRASAQPRALPGELTGSQGHDLIDQVAAFGRPSPILVLTGGDCLLRPDLFPLVDHARSAGIPVALSPAVSPALTGEVIGRIAASGVSAVSISLDGARAATHDGVRQIPGHFDATVTALHALTDAGVTVQVNTTVMRANAAEMADIALLLAGIGVHAWEVFFLVQTGRGVTAGEVTAGEHEAVCHFLYDAAHAFVVRTVEAPFFRRVVAERRAGMPPPPHPLYQALTQRFARGPRPGPAMADAPPGLPVPGTPPGQPVPGTPPGQPVPGVQPGLPVPGVQPGQPDRTAAHTPPGPLSGPDPTATHTPRLRPHTPGTHAGDRRSRAHTAATRDGKGIVFVAHNGDVYPAGFLPLVLGNVRDQPLGDIYRGHPLLRDIRAARFRGRCGHCAYADLCGGSRARAYAASGDPLGEDPACPFQPGPVGQTSAHAD